MYNILNDVPCKNQVDVENLNIKLNKNFNPILLFIETLTSWELEIFTRKLSHIGNSKSSFLTDNQF